jgi:hypothetical protein
MTLQARQKGMAEGQMSAKRHLPANGPDAREDRAALFSRANINPSTGLATDYLNHFNEAIMLLEMMASCPECGDDFRAWRPMSYREHFAQPHYKHRAVAIAAYDDADPTARQYLDILSDAMTDVLEATRKALAADLPPKAAVQLAQRTAAWLRPLVARAAAVINGETDRDPAMSPQAAIDQLMNR